MRSWTLLAAPCYGLIPDDNFTVTKCNNDDGQPELTFTVNEQYFEENLAWLTDQVDFKTSEMHVFCTFRIILK